MKLPSWPVLIGISVLVVFSVVLSIMFRLGSFKPVVVERKQNNGPLVVLMRDHLGAYHKIAGLITEVETWARVHGEPCTITFGQYFDHPEQTDEDRLRSRGGCVLSNPEKVEELKKLIGDEPKANPTATSSPADSGVTAAAGSPAAVASARSAGLKIETIEISDALVAEFDGSPSIGPLKVYPKAFEMMKQLDLRSSGAVVELYEVLGEKTGRTKYFFPIESSRK